MFLAARNRVTLFEDVVPALTRLRESYVLVALTDGNACLNLVGLGRYFHHYINAVTVGAPKPHVSMFDAVRRVTGLRAHEIAHVGDDPEKDVAGARRSGFRAVWINRVNSPWPSEYQPPDAELDGLASLAAGLERRR